MGTKVLIKSVELLAALCCLGIPAAAQNMDSSGSNWNSAWGFASSSERQFGLNQAQAQRAARQPTPNSVTYETVYNNTTNTNTVGSMNTGDTTVTVTGDGNTLNTTNTSNNAGCQDGSVGWTTGEAKPTGASQEYSFAVTNAGTATYCTVGN